MPVRRLSAGLLVAARVLVLTQLALALFWAGALLFAGLAGWMGGTPVADSGLLLRGTVCGLVAALFIAVFHLKQQSLRLAAREPDAFLDRVRPLLAELGYSAGVVKQGRHLFRPPFRSLLFGSGIRVELADGWATVAGPKVYLELLRRRLRVQGFVEQAGRAPAAGHAEQLLRRVELNLRVTPEQWQAVQGGILTSLLGAGAEIGCLITVLAHAEAGFPEAVVDGAVREWLRKEQIHAEVRKQLLGLPEPTAVTEPTLLAVSRET